MKATVVTAMLAMALAGCDRAPPPTARPVDEADNAAAAAGAREANAMMAATRQDALETRVATLENEMDTLKAQVDTRADLSAALAPPPVVPHLPPEPGNGAAAN